MPHKSAAFVAVEVYTSLECTAHESCGRHSACDALDVGPRWRAVVVQVSAVQIVCTIHLARLNEARCDSVELHDVVEKICKFWRSNAMLWSRIYVTHNTRHQGGGRCHSNQSPAFLGSSSRVAIRSIVEMAQLTSVFLEQA